MGELGKVWVVGMVNGCNFVCFIVFCYWVLGKNGNFIGYVFGFDIKKSLFDFEVRLFCVFVWLFGVGVLGNWKVGGFYELDSFLFLLC